MSDQKGKQKPDSTDSKSSTEQSQEPGNTDEAAQVEALLDDGLSGVVEGREFISLRSDGSLAPNANVSERYFQGYKSVVFLYDSDNDRLALKPVNDYEADSMKQVELAFSEGRVTPFSVSAFIERHGINAGKEDKTLRYRPEWEEDREVLWVDFNQDPKVVGSPKQDG